MNTDIIALTPSEFDATDELSTHNFEHKGFWQLVMRRHTEPCSRI